MEGGYLRLLKKSKSNNEDRNITPPEKLGRAYSENPSKVEGKEQKDVISEVLRSKSVVKMRKRRKSIPEKKE